MKQAEMSEHQKEVVQVATIILDRTPRCEGCGELHFSPEESERVLDGIAVLEEFNLSLEG